MKSEKSRNRSGKKSTPKQCFGKDWVLNVWGGISVELLLTARLTNGLIIRRRRETATQTDLWRNYET
jgi:hypothetical protein